MNKTYLVYSIISIYILLIIAAVTMPKVAIGNNDGLAAAGIGAITFLFFFGLSVLTAFIGLIIVLKSKDQLKRFTFWVGLVPMGISTLLILFLLGLLIYENFTSYQTPVHQTPTTIPSENSPMNND